jgi:drug/metabolite transporter (DMT)-like permease
MSAAGTLRVEARPAWTSAMPGVFVVLWSTGFVGAKLGLPYAGPLTFLALRFAVVTGIMLTVALATRAAWPHPREAGHAAVVGLLIQFLYLGGVFFGISRGVSAGVAALIVGVQPILTAAFAGAVVGDRVTRRQWTGLALGLVGVACVVWEKIDLAGAQSSGLLAVVGALLGITFGTLYQKRYCGGIDLRCATVLQNASAGAAMLACAFLLEPMRIAWTAEFVFALLWLCLVLSVGATILLLWLIRHGAASRVASLFYLVPPVTAFMAFLLFRETLGLAALAGMGLTMAGVALVNRG